MYSFGHAFAHPLRLTLAATAVVCAAGLLWSVSEPGVTLAETPLEMPSPSAQPVRSAPPLCVEPIARSNVPAPVLSTAPSAAPVSLSVKPRKEPPTQRARAEHRQGEPTRLQTKARRANDVVVAYQRVGRELMKLEKQRGLATTLELRAEFRALDLDTLTTAEARAEAARQLEELSVRIARVRGIELSQQCIDSPVGVGCEL